MKLTVYAIAFVICTAAVVVTAGAIGNALPEPHRSFVPMLVGDDFVRDEFIRRHPLAETSSPCIALLGDSRTAFNIAATTIDSGLPHGCRAQNYGFPGIGLDKVTGIASRLTATRAIVFSVTEPYVTGSNLSWIHTNVGQRIEEAFRVALLKIEWVRSTYLGHHRLNQYVRKSLGMSTALDSGWSWSGAQKRWLYAGLEARAMVNLSTYEREAKAIAVSYFGGKQPGDSREVAQLLRMLAARTERLFVVLPPSERRFQDLAETLSPGQQQGLWQLIRDEANRAGAVLIDCSRAKDCGVEPAGFGDPVHLNDAGVAMYSRFLAGRLGSYITP